QASGAMPSVSSSAKILTPMNSASTALTQKKAASAMNSRVARSSSRRPVGAGASTAESVAAGWPAHPGALRGRDRGAVRGGLRVRWRLPARARAARIALVEQHHLADRLAAGEAVEAGVDVVQRQRMREQPVHRQARSGEQQYVFQLCDNHVWCLLI